MITDVSVDACTMTVTITLPITDDQRLSIMADSEEEALNKTENSTYEHIRNLAPWKTIETDRRPYARDIQREEAGGIT